MGKLTQITSIYPQRMSKEYKLVDGVLQKSTSANLASGQYKILDIDGLEAMAALLTRLETNQVLVFGLPPADEGLLTTKDRIKQTMDPSIIARSNDYLTFSPAPSWMFLDYDPHGPRAYGMEELRSLLEHAIPDLFRAGAVMFPSASSNITDTTTGKDLTGNRGIHVYIPVATGKDISRASNAIQDRLWLNGYGYIEISKSGSLLERTLLDPSVAQDAKIDFAAGAVCHAPLKQCRPDPWIIEPTSKDAVLDTAKYIKQVRDKRQLEQVKQDAKEALRAQSLEIRENHARARALKEARDEVGNDTPNPEIIDRCYNRIMRAIEGKPLSPSFIIYVQFGSDMVPTTISTILADPSRYDGLLCLDPIEPDYEGNKVVGKIFFRGDKSFVSSFAHGGRKFPFGGSETFHLHIDRKNHMSTANAIIDLLTDAPEFGFLAHCGGFYQHVDSHYESVQDDESNMFLRTYLGNATCDDKDGNPMPVNPDNAYIANVIEALRAQALVKIPEDAPPPPFMLEAQSVCHGLGRVYVPRKNDKGEVERGRYIALRNGLFDLETDSLAPHTLAYFNTSVTDFDYDENAKCPRMLETVGGWFDGDEETIDVYFRMLGYLASSSTEAHKIFGLYGPPRSGKGVTQSIIEALVGRSGIFSTNIEALTQPFGLQQSIYKKVLLFADVKDSFNGGGGAGERLLKISASDIDSIPRKHIGDYCGRHTARVVMCGNAPPRLPDSSRALFERFVIMTFTKSYLGMENENLTKELLAEMPGIFNRALQGYREWQSGIKFASPKASAEHVRQVRDAISPIPGFLEECCEVGEGFSIDKEVLYERYVSFTGLSGNHSKSKNVFFRDLYAYDMRFKSTRIRQNGRNGHIIEHIKLADYDSEITLANGQTFVKNSGPDSTVVTGKTILRGEG